MQKAIDGLARIDAAIANGTLVFNESTAKQHAEVKDKLASYMNHATDADKATLASFDAKLDANKKIMETHGVEKNGEFVAKAELQVENLNKTKTGQLNKFNAAKAEHLATQNKKESFLRGDAVEGVEHKLSDAVKKARTEAENGANQLVGKVESFFGIGRTQEKGWRKALDKNISGMNVFKEGLTGSERAMAFGRVVLVGASGAAIVDAVTRSKDSNGDDRSGAFRVLEAVAGGAVGAGSLLYGRALVR